jgi:hypothetical protein
MFPWTFLNIFIRFITTILMPLSASFIISAIFRAFCMFHFSFWFMSHMFVLFSGLVISFQLSDNRNFTVVGCWILFYSLRECWVFFWYVVIWKQLDLFRA